MKKRLRKKLHKDEYQQLGLEVAFDYTETKENAFDQFLDDLIDFVERHGLFIAGGGDLHLKYLVYTEKTSISPDQRQSLIDWLNQHPDVSNVVDCGLCDLWYGWD